MSNFSPSLKQLESERAFGAVQAVPLNDTLLNALYWAAWCRRAIIDLTLFLPPARNAKQHVGSSATQQSSMATASQGWCQAMPPLRRPLPAVVHWAYAVGPYPAWSM